MLLLVGEDVLQQQPAALVGAAALLDPGRQAGDGLLLCVELGPELLRDRHADLHRKEPLHVGHAVEVEDPLDELLGVLHLAEGLLPALVGQALVAPVVLHLGVDEVLVDRRQLSGQDVVEQLDDLRRRLHAPEATPGVWGPLD